MWRVNGNLMIKNRLKRSCIVIVRHLKLIAFAFSNGGFVLMTKGLNHAKVSIKATEIWELCKFPYLNWSEFWERLELSSSSNLISCDKLYLMFNRRLEAWYLICMILHMIILLLMEWSLLIQNEIYILLDKVRQDLFAKIQDYSKSFGQAVHIIQSWAAHS